MEKILITKDMVCKKNAEAAKKRVGKNTLYSLCLLFFIVVFLFAGCSGAVAVAILVFCVISEIAFLMELAKAFSAWQTLKRGEVTVVKDRLLYIRDDKHFLYTDSTGNTDKWTPKSEGVSRFYTFDRYGFAEGDRVFSDPITIIWSPEEESKYYYLFIESNQKNKILCAYNCYYYCYEGQVK